jgi:hypothetical protein
MPHENQQNRRNEDENEVRREEREELFQNLRRQKTISENRKGTRNT